MTRERKPQTVDISTYAACDEDDVPPDGCQSVGCNDDLRIDGSSNRKGYGATSAATALNEGYQVLDKRRPGDKERRGIAPPQRGWDKF